MENALANLSTFGILGVIVSLSGFFLILAGLGVIKVQKISVLVGKKTWFFGIICLLIGGVFLLLDARDSTAGIMINTEPDGGSLTNITSTVTYTMFEVGVESINGCVVTLNGFDDPNVSMKLTWQWGDDTFTEGEFPQQHKYTNSGSYTLKVSDPFGNSKVIYMDVTCP